MDFQLSHERVKGHASCEWHDGYSSDGEEMFPVSDGTEKGLETDMENSFWILMEQRCKWIKSFFFEWDYYFENVL